jgi:hypothetical protein
MLEYFKKQHRSIQFTITGENNKQIAYLDINILHKQGTIGIDIYKKPVTSDITIVSASCYSDKYKMATFKNWMHRLNKLSLSKTNRVKELHTITNITENDGYNKQQIIKLYNLGRKKKRRKDTLKKK